MPVTQPLAKPFTKPLSLPAPDSPSPPAPQRDANAWFGDHFGVALPRGLREQAVAMTWDSFVATYGHTAGPLRLGHWACTDTGRSGGRLGPQARNFRAMLAVGDCLSRSTAAASGPIAGLTAMLHERGIAIETVKFHQMSSDECTVTFICGSDGIRTEWAMGLCEDATQSALRALIACANRLLA
ncbi:homocitrate synthase [Mycobacterium sp. Aquia_216]|uniref:homocitrate synthase n=1 Tax=Mycobacterium sp. Aquia_216 TaxID=2991729 RepID=UPI00227A9DEF|nr:homocitrate synthase [Mycobacterium sp. Aquia_216]WAJ46730.1 homocitrate synthase [Mycobacterium sp. Aquia_216]